MILDNFALQCGRTSCMHGLGGLLGLSMPGIRAWPVESGAPRWRVWPAPSVAIDPACQPINHTIPYRSFTARGFGLALACLGLAARQQLGAACGLAVPHQARRSSHATVEPLPRPRDRPQAASRRVLLAHRPLSSTCTAGEACWGPGHRGGGRRPAICGPGACRAGSRSPSSQAAHPACPRPSSSRARWLGCPGEAAGSGQGWRLGFPPLPA